MNGNHEQGGGGQGGGGFPPFPFPQQVGPVPMHEQPPQQTWPGQPGVPQQFEQPPPQPPPGYAPQGYGYPPGPGAMMPVPQMGAVPVDMGVDVGSGQLPPHAPWQGPAQMGPPPAFTQQWQNQPPLPPPPQHFGGAPAQQFQPPVGMQAPVVGYADPTAAPSPYAPPHGQQAPPGGYGGVPGVAGPGNEYAHFGGGQGQGQGQQFAPAPSYAPPSFAPPVQHAPVQQAPPLVGQPFIGPDGRQYVTVPPDRPPAAPVLGQVVFAPPPVVGAPPGAPPPPQPVASVPAAVAAASAPPSPNRLLALLLALVNDPAACQVETYRRNFSLATPAGEFDGQVYTAAGYKKLGRAIEDRLRGAIKSAVAAAPKAPKAAKGDTAAEVSDTPNADGEVAS